MVIYYTYIVESIRTSNWYIGHSDNTDRRLVEHNSGQNKSTRGRGPWKIIFLRSFSSKIEANRFELKLKKLRNKDYIRKEYSEYFLDT